MRARLVLVAMVLVLGALAWLLYGGGPAPGAREARPGPAPVAGATPAIADGAVPESAARREVEPPSAAKASEPAPDVVFTGRCVAAEDGHALQGVTVSHAPSRKLEVHGALAELKGNGTEPKTVSTTSDGEGRFELPCWRSSGWLHSLTFETPGRARVEGDHHYARGRVDLGDIPLTVAVAAAAWVVDAFGAPVPGVDVILNGPTIEKTQGWSAGQLWIDLQSRPDGSLALPPLLPGPWSVTCRDFEVTGPRKWEVVAGGPPFDIVVNGRPETISGTVVDPQGLPIQGVAVQPAQRGSYPGGVPLTDAEGRFAVRRWSMDRPEPHRLQLTRPGHRSLQTGPVAWGTKELRFELQPMRQLDVLAIDAATTLAVEHFGLRILWSGAVKGDWRTCCGAVTHVGRHEGGRVRIALDDGPHRIYVQPAGTQYEVSDPVDLVVGDGLPTQFVVRLSGLEARTVQVTDGSDRGMAGSKVELIRPGRKLIMSHN